MAAIKGLKREFAFWVKASSPVTSTKKVQSERVALFAVAKGIKPRGGARKSAKAAHFGAIREKKKKKAGLLQEKGLPLFYKAGLVARLMDGRKGLV